MAEDIYVMLLVEPFFQTFTKKPVPNAPQDHGFMYGHGFEDLDGHVWELVYMDAGAAPAQA